MVSLFDATAKESLVCVRQGTHLACTPHPETAVVTHRPHTVGGNAGGGGCRWPLCPLHPWYVRSHLSQYGLGEEYVMQLPYLYQHPDQGALHSCADAHILCLASGRKDSWSFPDPGRLPDPTAGVHACACGPPLVPIVRLLPPISVPGALHGGITHAGAHSQHMHDCPIISKKRSSRTVGGAGCAV